MQTFLPFPSFSESARSLDQQRLGKQRIEGVSLLRALSARRRTPQASHPAAVQWTGYEQYLVAYVDEMREEWCRRGFSDSLDDEMANHFGTFDLGLRGSTPPPPWLGVAMYHDNHKRRLVAKHPAHYAEQFAPHKPEPFNLWPITTKGAWVYMIDGKTHGYAPHDGEPYRLVGWREDWTQCPQCRHWVNKTDVTTATVEGVTADACPICAPLLPMYDAAATIRREMRKGGELATALRPVADGLDRDILALVQAARAGIKKV